MDKQKRCAECAHVRDDRDEGDAEPDYVCIVPVPFWVRRLTPVIGQIVSADDGKSCSAFQSTHIQSTP